MDHCPYYLLGYNQTLDRVHFINPFKVSLKRGMCPALYKCFAYQFPKQTCRVKWCFEKSHECGLCMKHSHWLPIKGDTRSFTAMRSHTNVTCVQETFSLASPLECQMCTLLCWEAYGVYNAMSSHNTQYLSCTFQT